ncbi:tRNA-modifying protein YgfZ [Buchnera aphidicola (Phyllaphis fagi)]
MYKKKYYDISDNILYNFLCSFTVLSDWSLIWVSGLDSKKYLQSQITINLFLLNLHDHILCAHCNYKGKVWSTLRLFHYKSGYAYIQRNSVCTIQIDELKKYSVFSDVNITRLHHFILLGISGLHSRNILLGYFKNLPDQKKSVIYINNNIVLWFQDPIERFLLILEKEDFIKLRQWLLNQYIKHVKNQWLFLDIQSGIPIIEKKTIGKYVPQEINLEYFNGIDFKKGCYCGQEIISRLHFRNVNKRKLYCLIGISNIIPNVLANVEMYDGIWKKVGNVFFVLHFQNNIFCIQCILNNKIDSHKIFRISTNVTSYFVIK